MMTVNRSLRTFRALSVAAAALVLGACAADPSETVEEGSSSLDQTAAGTLIEGALCGNLTFDPDGRQSALGRSCATGEAWAVWRLGSTSTIQLWAREHYIWEAGLVEGGDAEVALVEASTKKGSYRIVAANDDAYAGTKDATLFAELDASKDYFVAARFKTLPRGGLTSPRIEAFDMRTMAPIVDRTLARASESGGVERIRFSKDGRYEMVIGKSTLVGEFRTNIRRGQGGDDRPRIPSVLLDSSGGSHFKAFDVDVSTEGYPVLYETGKHPHGSAVIGIIGQQVFSDCSRRDLLPTGRVSIDHNYPRSQPASTKYPVALETYELVPRGPGLVALVPARRQWVSDPRYAFSGDYTDIVIQEYKENSSGHYVSTSGPRRSIRKVADGTFAFEEGSRSSELIVKTPICDG